MWPYAILIAGYLLANYYITGKAFVKQKQIKLHSLKFNLAETQKALFTKLFFDVVIKINNPTEFAATVRSYSLNLFYNGQLLTQAQTTGSVKINPNANTPISFKAGISVLNLPYNVKDIVEKIKSRSPVNIQIIGEVQTTLGTYKFNEIQNVI